MTHPHPLGGHRRDAQGIDGTTRALKHAGGNDLQHAARDRDQAIAKALGTFVRDVQNTAETPADDPE
jgi:hypothetical protein